MLQHLWATFSCIFQDNLPEFSPTSDNRQTNCTTVLNISYTIERCLRAFQILFPLHHKTDTVIQKLLSTDCMHFIFQVRNIAKSCILKLSPVMFFVALKYVIWKSNKIIRGFLLSGERVCLYLFGSFDK